MPREQLERRPTWWLLYAMGMLLVVLVGLAERFVPPGPLRTSLECAAVIVVFALAAIWRRRNRIAIELERSRTSTF